MASWFRSWHGAPTDNKWLVIARRANVAPGVVSAVAWALLDHASQADERGSVAGFDVETYCAFSGFPEADVAAILDALQDKGVVDINSRLTAWDKRQPKREDDSSDRVRNWRAEHAKPVTPQVEQPVTHGNATKRNVTHGNNTDTDTEQKQSRAEHDDAEVPPEVRAVRNAYDASGLMMSKTHLDTHLETIKRTGLTAWRAGWSIASDKGKQNIPNFVARCAETFMLTEQRGSGNGRHAEPESNQEKLARVFASLNAEGATDGNRN